MQDKFEVMANKFGTPAKARSYAKQLVHAISHPEEEVLEKDQMYAANLTLSEVKEYLAMCDERRYE